MIKRHLLDELIKWKESQNRMPLILRGIRQVGKTTLVQQFGQQYFTNICTLNFEQKPELSSLFDSLDPNEIVFKLELATHEKIIPNQTLLFLDEIQESPKAIIALRYFKEQMPELHIIAAGSLLEFSLNSENLRMPVGRVQYLFLHPVSFSEFLGAIGEDQLYLFLKEITPNQSIEPMLHDKLIQFLKTYFIVGGMPGILQIYLVTKSAEAVREAQANLIQSFYDDFTKYHQNMDIKILRNLFHNIPRFLGQHIKFSRLIEGESIYKIKQHIEALQLAGMIIPIYKTKASGIPLGVDYKETNLKLLFADIGLANHICNLQLEIDHSSDVLLINQGAIAEQFVGQELIAYGPKYEKKSLYFWEREKVGTMAEIDYVIQVDSKIYPIEVKAGKTGRLKSLQQFIQEKKPPFGIQISQKPLHFENKILNVPLYLISELRRLMSTVN